MKFLFNFWGVSVKAVDSKRRTPLHLAAINRGRKRLQMIHLLNDQEDIDWNVKDETARASFCLISSVSS